MDSASEYERNANEYLRARDESSIGHKIIRQWATRLPAGSEVLEIACGGGLPVTRELSEAGLKLWAIDSSKTLLDVFMKRFPEVRVKCEKVQDSSFFSRQFDAVIAIGLLFLLPDHEQENLIQRVAGILKPDGKFLFMAPTKKGTWDDLNTGIRCRSLGFSRYQEILNKYGFKIISTVVDAGENNYYDTERQS